MASDDQQVSEWSNRKGRRHCRRWLAASVEAPPLCCHRGRCVLVSLGILFRFEWQPPEAVSLNWAAWECGAQSCRHSGPSKPENWKKSCRCFVNRWSLLRLLLTWSNSDEDFSLCLVKCLLFSWCRVSKYSRNLVTPSLNSVESGACHFSLSLITESVKHFVTLAH